MKARSLGHRVWEIENALPQEDLDLLLTLAKTSEEPLWYSDKVPEYWRGKVIMAVELLIQNKSTENFMDNLNAKLESIFDRAKSVLAVSSIIRYTPGESMDIHQDNVEAHDADNVFGLVLYLNDDYIGGEIYYPELGLEIKPKANSILIHYAGLKHGVKEVTSGVRYVITSFIKGDETTSIRESI